MSRYFFWAGMFTLIALVLYDIKYSVHSAQKETAALEKQLVAERQRLQMVQLEWAMLTRPERISALAKKYLTLTPLKTDQVMLEDAAVWRASTVGVIQEKEATKPTLTGALLE
jgi:cell division protein FtsL